MNDIQINGAREHNLKSVSVKIPGNSFVLVTGVSGSGKSSLVQNVIANEGQRLYLSQLNQRARQYFSKLGKPELDSIKGLSPVVALDQVSFSSNTRSTVGTLSDLYDLLRLLFARFSFSAKHPDLMPSRSLFSFNQSEGSCPVCNGLGLEEYIDPDTFIQRPDKSVKDGALSLTTPNGYVIYSQVTLEVLELVCRAEGFELSTPWNDLSDDNKNIILFGSEKIKIPFGKHPLESRMKWSGITAKPRDEGYYRGMIPIMEEILKRDRNKNILKYTRARKCRACEGKRLKPEALTFHWQNYDIAELAACSIDQLRTVLKNILKKNETTPPENHVISTMIERIEVISKLGIDYLTLDRESTSLSFGEIKRLRLSTLIQNVLCGLIYTLDEPTVGLHPKDHENLLKIMRDVCDNGNTLIVIDHKNIGFDFADFWIEMGPGAGYKGGEVLFAGDKKMLKKHVYHESSSLAYLNGTSQITRLAREFPNREWIRLEQVDLHNLNSISVKFLVHGLNVICGVSGAGKTSLLTGTLYPLLSGEFINGSKAFVETDIPIHKIIKIDQKPIGRNSRSNPATYTKLFDKIRDLFGMLPEAADKGWDKSHFSFNVDGGRCPECKGAGNTEIGVSYLGRVDLICESCQGKRFTADTLDIRFNGKNIHEILEMEVDEALDFFNYEKTISPYLKWLSNLGLGYLKLGQPSGTLSGGEAQRIKLASELVHPSKGHTLYLLDEPASGLHPHDIQIMLNALDELVSHGHTLILVEHDPDLVRLADWIVELGPGGGSRGGNLIFSGTPSEINKAVTPMAEALMKNQARRKVPANILEKKYLSNQLLSRNIEMKGVRTNNLKGFNIDIPLNEITAITGVSGSGKTSLVYDTLYSSAQYYFSQTFSPYVRTMIGGNQPGDFDSAKGLLPALAIKQKVQNENPRSTLATLSGILPVLRLLVSRFALDESGLRSGLLGRQFSFNDKSGACFRCAGLGTIKQADQDKFITDHHLTVYDGALSGTRTGKFFADPNGQFIAILKAVEKALTKNFHVPWNELYADDQETILKGTGDVIYDVVWDYKRKNLSGSHNFKSTWKGFSNLINEEYVKRTGTTRQAGLENVMNSITCPDCEGDRINPERLAYFLGDKNIADWLKLSVSEFQIEMNAFSQSLKNFKYQEEEIKFINQSLEGIFKVLSGIEKLGLGYLQLSRSVSSLSSGEYQRVRLSAQLGSELSGMLYLIDEPSTALHPSNLNELWEIFSTICSDGNTIVMVDHNPAFYNKADNVFELGPGGGDDGGEIVKAIAGKDLSTEKGEVYDIKNYLTKRINFSRENLLATFHKIEKHNLKIDHLELPRGWVCLAGVSGSGKSTLMGEILRLLSSIAGTNKFIISTEEITNWAWYHSPLSGLGVDEMARKEFCSNIDAGSKQVKPEYFKKTGKGGRCEDCQGKGSYTISLDFLGSSLISCDSCQGTGYSEEARMITSNGLSFDGFLQLSLENLFKSKAFKNINPSLELAVQMGLGYLKAGQKGNSLSPGEKQRLLLAREFNSGRKETGIFLFDEPTRGLHLKDTGRFIAIIRQMVDQGHSIIMVEHNPALLRHADWLIELGPGGGDMGGQIIYSGTPENMGNSSNTPTSMFLNA